MDFNNLRQQLGYGGFTFLTCLSGIGLAVTMRQRYPGVWIRVVLALVLELTIELASAIWYSLYDFVVSERNLLSNWQFSQVTYVFNLGFAVVFGLLIWAAFSGRQRLG